MRVSKNPWLRLLSKAVRVSRQRTFRRALCFGVAPTVEHRDVGFRNSFATIIDVGANRGQFALFVLEKFPHSRVICFEPLPDPADKLGLVLKPFVGRYDLRRVALGSERGTAAIFESKKSDSSSLLKPTDTLTSEFPESSTAGTSIIDVRTLDGELGDSRLQRPVLLKLDVQGFESIVLDGGSQTLGYVDEVFAELSFLELYDGQELASDVVCKLHQFGFLLVGVHSVGHAADGRCTQADFHFVRSAGKSF